MAQCRKIASSAAGNDALSEPADKSDPPALVWRPRSRGAGATGTRFMRSASTSTRKVLRPTSVHPFAPVPGRPDPHKGRQRPDESWRGSGTVRRTALDFRWRQVHKEIRGRIGHDPSAARREPTSRWTPTSLIWPGAWPRRSGFPTNADERSASDTVPGAAFEPGWPSICHRARRHRSSRTFMGEERRRDAARSLSLGSVPVKRHRAIGFSQNGERKTCWCSTNFCGFNLRTVRSVFGRARQRRLSRSGPPLPSLSSYRHASPRARLKRA